MKFIIKLFPEITIKSKPVRKQLVNQLRDNMRRVLKQVNEHVKVTGQWDRIDVDIDAPGSADDQGTAARIAQALQCIPGIANFIEVTEHSFSSFDDIFQLTKNVYAETLAGKSFVVRVKRAGKHDFKSGDVERYVGGGLLQHTGARAVDLHNPDLTVNLEIRDDKLYIITRRYEGLGGFPLGSQDAVLSLISGGFDSTVSSYLTMRRGLKTHFCFFNLGGSAHEVGVKQVALYLWEKYSQSHRVKFVTVPFEAVVAEILRSVHHSQMGVVLKRMMMRAAATVADEMKLVSLVTGESVAQVSSQTLMNLSVIDCVTDKLILRPLVTMDKLDIIRLSAQIGTEDFAKNMPEYCGVISDRPTTRAKMERIVEEEGNFNFDVLEQAIAEKATINIDEVMDSIVIAGDVEVVSTPAVNDVIVDIRHPNEEEKSPLELTNNEILKIPFYELASGSLPFDADKRYLLFCEKGTMSQLHASHMKQEGKANVLVYKP
ncbi:thiamine biosynthesis protein ThiI [Oleiphilus messinensis]|uniref:Probable tRNA sulfurtransferase n=1 Tax=Oleiphilus messinensis TaxID=141451 RepID=A0A1Y0IE49_9GAMM|nr:tRNA uracil 4-sulfurtransferase ThiI [Oleiphilus messinensis]ARU58798.1 thiamine biosynthesis protein ThiI [Oleiphilus messinensis]